MCARRVPDAGLGFVLWRQGRLDEATEHLRSALDADPKQLAAHDHLGSIHADQGRLDEAESHFRKLVSLRPTADAHEKLAAILMQRGEEDEARQQREFAKALGGGRRAGAAGAAVPDGLPPTLPRLPGPPARETP